LHLDKEKLNMGSNQLGVSKGFTVPQDFFTAATFGTCGGCATATWVVTGVLSGLFHADTGIVGLITAMIVAYAGLFLSGARQKSQYIITFFNGFLIYATVVGATSFLPYINQKTADVVQSTKPNITSSLTRPWIQDRNLISATKNLINVQQEQSTVIHELDRTITSTENSLKQEQNISAEIRTRLLNQLSDGKREIQTTREKIVPETNSLRRLGLTKLPIQTDSPR
jgi:hypothetical protein